MSEAEPPDPPENILDAQMIAYHQRPFWQWWITISKIPYRSKEELAEMAWDAALAWKAKHPPESKND